MKLLNMGILACLSALFSCSTGKTYESLSEDAFEKVIQSGSVILVDVRTPEEYVNGHLPGAMNIDVQDSKFKEKAEAALPKGQKLALYCRSGRRSKIAADILVKDGYSVVELGSGYLGWLNANKGVVR